MGWELGWNQRACRLPQVISKIHISFAVDTLHVNCCDFISPHLLTPKKGFSRGIPSKWPECSSVNYHRLKFHLHESGIRQWNLIHWCVVASSTSSREACATIAPTYVPHISKCNSQFLCGKPGYQILLLSKDDGHAQAWMCFFLWSPSMFGAFRALQLSTSHSPWNPSIPCKLHFFCLLGWYAFGSPTTTWFEQR